MSDEDDDEPEVVDSESVEAEASAAREEIAEVRSREARHRLRDQMQSEIEEFLRRGGRIEHVEPSVTAQPTPLATPVESGDADEAGDTD